MAMTEVCFCGWSGEFEDKEPVLLGNELGALCCPGCGRVDTLDALPPSVRAALLQAARERQAMRRFGIGVAA
jgi:hypothetical protein